MAARFAHLNLRRNPHSRRPAFVGCLLSRKELDTLDALARGLTYCHAAAEMGCSCGTVRSQVRSACRRLDVTTPEQALELCTELGWLDPVPGNVSTVQLADQEVTWAQRLYLEAFDQFLRARSDATEVKRTELLRDAAMTGMFREADQQRPPRRAMKADPLERIASTLRRYDARVAARQDADQR